MVTKPCVMSLEEQIYHNTTWICHICNDHIHNMQLVTLHNLQVWRCEVDGCHTVLTSKQSDGDRKVIDHCHWSSSYRGPAHHRCNSKYVQRKLNWKLPIFFHNGRRFDNHLILEALSNQEEDITVLPHSLETFISFSYNRCEIKDSFQFMHSSLDDLSKKLPRNDAYLNSLIKEALEGDFHNKS